MYKIVFLVRTDLKMGKGKIAAQVAHAAIQLYKRALQECPETLKAWEAEGGKKIVLKVRNEEELLKYYEILKKRFPTVLITDAGLTQIPAGSKTVVGSGPAPSEELDKIVGHLKLL